MRIQSFSVVQSVFRLTWINLEYLTSSLEYFRVVQTCLDLSDITKQVRSTQDQSKLLILVLLELQPISKLILELLGLWTTSKLILALIGLQPISKLILALLGLWTTSNLILALLDFKGELSEGIKVVRSRRDVN